MPLRDGMSPGGPMRPGGPLPPREPVNPIHPGPPGRGTGSGPGRHSGGPGYAVPGGPPRPGSSGPAGAPGFSGPAESSRQFDGGYAHVIRAADNPVRPASHAQPANPAQPAGFGSAVDDADVVDDAEVYVYRDTSEPSGPPAAAAAAAAEPVADERDASYWYDLSGEDRSPVPAETRGPFEPLMSSSRPPSDPASPPSSSAQGPGGPGATAKGAADKLVEPDVAGDHGDENSAHEHARKLEQIKDFYLTAEAIGEQNVDKHFDQLLAQQRDLISEYFKQSDAGDGLAARGETQGETQAGAPAGADPARLDGPRAPGLQPDAPPGASVAADQPRVW